MKYKHDFFVATLSIIGVLPLFAQAQDCTLSAGTVGLGRYCQKPSISETREGLAQNQADASQIQPYLQAANVVALQATQNKSAANKAETSKTIITKADPAPTTTQAEPPPPQATPTKLSIQAGQRLSVALGNWLKSQNIALSWEPLGTLPGRVRDVVIESTWLATHTSLEPSLTEVLAPFGLTAHVLHQGASDEPTSIVVRNASNARP